MKKNYLFPLLLAIAASVFLTSCGNKPPKPNPAQTEIKSAVRVNPYPRGTYEHFKFDSYPGTTRTWKNTALLAQANPSNTKVRIDLSSQRGFLLVNDEVAMDYRVSTGSSKHKTPTGDYKIIEKIREKRSNLYGKILNASGAVVQSNADARKDTVPAGGSFRGASMPYWMRLTRTGIGMHQGNVNRRYASHGCIRTHYSAVPIVYSKTKIGTPVTVTN
jgi:lipoprotein-anchoring transpeptidase ErfK/SrfK